MFGIGDPVTRSAQGRAAFAQQHGVQHVLLFIKRGGYPVNLFGRHHIRRDPLLDLGKALVVGGFEGFESLHEILEGFRDILRVTCGLEFIRCFQFGHCNHFPRPATGAFRYCFVVRVMAVAASRISAASAAALRSRFMVLVAASRTLGRLE